MYFDVEKILWALDRNRGTGNTTKLASLNGINLVVHSHQFAKYVRNINSNIDVTPLLNLSENPLGHNNNVPIVFDNASVHILLSNAESLIRELNKQNLELRRKMLELEDSIAQEKRTINAIISEYQAYRFYYENERAKNAELEQKFNSADEIGEEHY